jgi:hypothetical protein
LPEILFKFFQLLPGLTMVAQAVVAVTTATLLINFKYRRGKAIDHECDHSSGVGVEGQSSHVKHRQGQAE